jgi:hypothetical protein
MTITRLAASVAIIACAIVSVLGAHNYLAACNIGFDNQFALTNVYAQARATFASSTGLSANGQLELCDPATHSACWTYRERCGSRGYVNVEDRGRLVKRKIPTNRPGQYKVVVVRVHDYNHFHLGFEDPNLTCFAAAADNLGSGFGRTNAAGNCVAADWKREPRIAMTHDSSQWLRVWVEDFTTHASRIFDVTSINIRPGSAACQVWFKTADGSWYGWSRLQSNVWDISEDAFEITDLVVGAATGEIGPIAVDDIFVLN